MTAAAFRLYSKMDTFTGTTGAFAGLPLNGGYLTFCLAGTPGTPKVVYGEKALTTNNGSTITFDSTGHPLLDVWGSGSYYVQIYDSAGVKQGEADNTEIPGGISQVVPIPNVGEYLTGDGASILAALLRLIPDPTGHSNTILGTDGSVISWVARPADGTTPTTEPLPVGGVVVGTTYVKLGKFIIQTGSDSAPASGGHTTSKAITYPTAMATALFVGIQPTIAVVTGAGYSGVPSVTGMTATGATVNFDVDASSSGATIAFPITFNYLAIGILP